MAVRKSYRERLAAGRPSHPEQPSQGWWDASESGSAKEGMSRLRKSGAVLAVSHVKTKKQISGE